MTREEQITFEADKYTDTRNNYVEWGNGWEDFDDKEYVEKAFQAGAKWADENPIAGLVSLDKVCKYLESLTYQYYVGAPLERYVPDYIIDNLCKAMEE